MACVAYQVSFMALCHLCVCGHGMCRFSSYFSRRVIFKQIRFLGILRFKVSFSWCVSVYLLVSLLSLVFSCLPRVARCHLTPVLF